MSPSHRGERRYVVLDGMRLPAGEAEFERQ